MKPHDARHLAALVDRAPNLGKAAWWSAFNLARRSSGLLTIEDAEAIVALAGWAPDLCAVALEENVFRDRLLELAAATKRLLDARDRRARTAAAHEAETVLERISATLLAPELPAVPLDQQMPCDWGDCENPAVNLRWDPNIDRYLPVCRSCAEKEYHPA